ncbi:hypothetical protein ACN8ZM_39970 (plasmid) [Burkholderia aenigmatica]|uniref:hypothetical protein n=1 Tax=Burkholderia aenigmatica TaxID=2015348 RepID=UPI003B4314F3
MTDDPSGVDDFEQEMLWEFERVELALERSKASLREAREAVLESPLRPVFVERLIPAFKEIEALSSNFSLVMTSQLCRRSIGTACYAASTE